AAPTPPSCVQDLGEGSHGAILSPSGRYVAFSSTNAALFAGDSNGKIDAFLRDDQTGVVELISQSTARTIGDRASRAMAMTPDGPNGKSDVFVHDRQTSTTTRVSVSTDGTQALGGHSDSPSLSADGRYVAFWLFASINGDGGLAHVYVRDLQTGVTTVMGSGS